MDTKQLVGLKDYKWSLMAKMISEKKQPCNWHFEGLETFLNLTRVLCSSLIGHKAISEFQNPQYTDSIWVNGAVQSTHTTSSA